MTTQITFEGYLDGDYLEGPYFGGIEGLVAGMQATHKITEVEKIVGMQALMSVPTDQVFGMEVKEDTLRHAICGGYLVEPYLEDAYLADRMCAFLGMQANMIIADVEHDVGMQAEMQIVDTEKVIGMQAVMHILTDLAIGMQANMLYAEHIGMQSTMVIYNTTQLRILCSFPSRGIPSQLGQNWTANSQESGDFYAYNVNTDIPEQVFRSIVDTNVQLTCDTGLPQGVFLDTLAIINHNFTTSAVVTLQGADNGAFSPVGINIPLTVEINNMFYIAPDLPLEGYRYWRIIVDDPTNPDGYVQVGIVIFGAATIFSVHENMENPIIKGLRHYKDAIPTEGFTNVMNDRALRKFIRMNFRDLDRDQQNYAILEEVFYYARTSLKCLWIPTPEEPSRFAIFGKLTSLPEESVIDHGEGGGYITLDVEIDESN